MEDINNFESGLEGIFLEYLHKEQIEISIYLVNGIRLKGIISKFNKNTILLKNGNIQLIRLEAVSTIMPTSSMDENVIEAMHSKLS